MTGLCHKWSLKQAIKVAEEHFEAHIAAKEKRIVGRTEIFGQQVFADEVEQALHSLTAQAPYARGLVDRYVRAVVESENPPKSGVFIGVVYQQTNKAGRLPWAANRFAALLMRRALRTRLTVGFGLPSSPRSELFRLREELRTMEKLNCHPNYFRDQLEQIARVRSRTKLRRRRAGYKGRSVIGKSKDEIIRQRDIH